MPKNTAIKKKALIIAVCVLVFGGQSFAAENKTSVAHAIQDFFHTAQGKKQTNRSNLGEGLISRIQSIVSPRNQQTRQTQGPLIASRQIQHNITSQIQKQQTIKNPTVFFEDIGEDPAAYSIAILASHELFVPAKRFFPHNYVRLADLSKILVNSYRISIGMQPIDATPKQFVQTAFDEGRLQNVITTVSPKNIEKVVLYKDMQHIAKNIHRQYPTHTADVVITQDGDDILRKGSMSAYVVDIFGLETNIANYHKYQHRIIGDSPYAQAVYTLIQMGIASSDIQADQTISRATFITQLVNAYAQNNPVILRNITHDIADIDNQDDNSRLLVYAYNQGRLEYILIHTKGQTFLEPTQTITIDEIYEIIQKTTGQYIISGVIDPQKAITQGEIAQILIDVFDIPLFTLDTQPIQFAIQNNQEEVGIVARIRGLLAQL